MSMELNAAEMWRAVETRDAAYDTCFYYGVTSTGVYCRPSCPSRRPLRTNVEFFLETADAERAGYRACQRCRPSNTSTLDARLAEACATIRAKADETLPLAELARAAGLSASHFQRAFQAAFGVSPKQFQAACRLDAFKQALKRGASVTEAIYAAGYGSASRVYESSGESLGMTPAQYAKGGAGLAISYAVVATKLGAMALAATDRGLCSIQFGSDAQELLALLQSEFPQATLEAARSPYPEQFELWIDALRKHLDGHPSTLELDVELRGTAFQCKVWRYLRTIPAGTTQSYAQVAEALGQPTATRAVARACAANRVAIVVPCHRVIRGTGELGGYRWGIERKRALIEVERAADGVSLKS